MGKRAIAVALFLVAAVSGCTPQNVYVPQRVEIPVPVACVRAIPPRPTLPLVNLTPASPADETVRLYVETVIALEGDDAALRDTLRACMAPKPLQ